MYNLLYYFTVQVSKISDIFHLWSPKWWWRMWVKTSLSQMCVGSRYRPVYSPGELGFDLGWVSWHSELHWFKYKKQKISNSKLKRKKVSETREERICHPYRMIDGFLKISFLLPPPSSRVSPFSWRNATVCSVGWSCIQSGVASWWFEWMSMRFENGVFSTFFYSTTKCVCMSVYVLAAAVTIKPTDSPVMLELTVHYYLTVCNWSITFGLSMCPRQAKAHVSLFFFLFPHKISRDMGGWGPGSGPIGRLVPPPGSAAV